MSAQTIITAKIQTMNGLRPVKWGFDARWTPAAALQLFKFKNKNALDIQTETRKGK